MAYDKPKMGRMMSAVGRGLLGDSETGKAGRQIGKALRKRADSRRDPMGGRRKAERER